LFEVAHIGIFEIFPGFFEPEEDEAVDTIENKKLFFLL
jgi:hypothetical protein